MKVEKCICDECGVERKEANHWFMGHVCGGTTFFLTAWRLDHDLVLSDYCGQQCVHAAIDRFMSTGSIEKKETAE